MTTKTLNAKPGEGLTGIVTDIGAHFKGGGSYRLLFEFVMLILACVMTFIVTFKNLDRVPVFFDAYHIDNEKPYDLVNTMFDTEVYGINTVTGWGATAALHKADMQISLKCNGSNSSVGICEHCIDVYAGIIAEASTTAAGAFAAKSASETVVTPIKNNMLGCVFREFGQFSSRFAYYMNPWLHFFVWNIIMFVQALAVHAWIPGRSDNKSTLHMFAQWTGGFIFILFVAAFITFLSASNNRTNPLFHVSTWEFDLSVTLVLFVLGLLPPALFWTFTYGQSDRYKNHGTVTAIDVSIIASSIPIVTIVACFAGWLDVTLLNYLYTTIILLACMSTLDDYILLHINGHDGRSNARSSLIVARLQLWFLAIFVFVFMGFVYMPVIPNGDYFSFSTIVSLFVVYVIGVSLATPLASFLTNDPETAKNSATAKALLECIFRVVVFVYLYQVAQDPYTA